MKTPTHTKKPNNVSLMYSPRTEYRILNVQPSEPQLGVRVCEYKISVFIFPASQTIE